MNFRENIKNAKRIVFKFGTNALTKENGEIALSRIYSFIESISELKKQGKEIIIVTSGAVSMGMKKLGLDSKPVLVTLKQACAAIGQGELMYIYEEGFKKFSIITAHVLLKLKYFLLTEKSSSVRRTCAVIIENFLNPSSYIYISSP